MCVECGTALNVSTSAVADQERAFIRRQIAMGKDKQEIKDALVDQYGPGVLASPRRRASTRRLPRAAGCGLLALGGAGRRGAPLAPPRPEEAAPAAEPLADDDARRLDAELAAYDRR